MADFNFPGVRQSRTQALNLSGKNVRLSSPPSSKNLPEDDWTLLDENNTQQGGGG